MADNDTSVQVFSGELEFDYEKSNYFRVIHVDGAFGGVSPGSRAIHMAVYSERQPIPKKTVQTVQQGVLGPEILEKRIVRSGIFREIEADLVLSLDAAIALRTWLDSKVIELQKVNEQLGELEQQRKAEQ